MLLIRVQILTWVLARGWFDMSIPAKLVAASCSLILLAGCTDIGRPKQIGGTLSGAALGGFLGSQVGRGSGRMAATGAGVLLGGILGGAAGESLDRADTLSANEGQRQPYYAPPAPTYGYQPYGYQRPSGYYERREYRYYSGQPRYYDNGDWDE